MDYHQFTVIFLVLLLGIRHGLDTDHLAVINIIIQNTSAKIYNTKLVGFFFALGHGLIVTLISILLGMGIKHFIPDWLNNVGSFMSAFLLMIFGLMNLFNSVKKSCQQTVAQTEKMICTDNLAYPINHPVFICCIGALFALSFDTFSQAAVFSLSSCKITDCLFNSILGMMFTLGMIVSDGLNGWATAKLIRFKQLNKLSTIGSYLLTWAITLSAIIIGGLNVIKSFK